MTDIKVSAMNPDASPSLDDIFMTIDLGSGANKKVTLQDLITLMGNNIPSGIIDADNINWTTSGEIWWEELARVNASSGTTMEITSFAAKKHLQIIVVDTGSGANGSDMIFNNDTGSNYASSRTLSGGAFSSAVSGSNVEVMGNFKGMQRTICEIVNDSSYEKVMNATWVSGPQSGTQNSAAQLPSHGEYVNKWSNASAQITRVKVTRRGGAYAAGSMMIVLGHD